MPLRILSYSSLKENIPNVLFSFLREARRIYFRLILLGYTKERGVFEEWCGVELQDVRTYAQSLYKQLVASEANQAPAVKQLQDELATTQTKYDLLVKNMEALLNPPKAA